MNLRHLEWLIGELVPDPEMVVYGVLPYTAVDADRVIEQLWVLAGLEVGQGDEDLAGAEAGTADVRVHRRGRPRATDPARSVEDQAPDREVAMARSAQGAASRPWLVRRCDR